MGCDYYNGITFSTIDDDLHCLCTFPYNYNEIDKDLVRSMAYLGAAIVLQHHGEMNDDRILPQCLPQWIRDGIDKILGICINK